MTKPKAITAAITRAADIVFPPLDLPAMVVRFPPHGKKVSRAVRPEAAALKG
jgi:hypothetical protein